ncbi:MAG: hypothetical protein Q8K60_09105 [Parachlamydiaceae bacterium]|nr:hypothetical protein [Parachlamydiaceae bacterium]
MYKNATFKEKFQDLRDWLPLLINAIKKDLKSDHLSKDPGFVKKYFGARHPNKLTTDEIVEAYHRAIQEEAEGESIAEFIASRWIIKNSELLEFFEQELTKINPDYSAIEEITDEQANAIIESSIQEHGAPHTYLFSVLNSVFFTDNHFKALREKAHHQQKEQNEQGEQETKRLQAEKIERNFADEMARLSDKFEKKIAGLQKKYTTDTDALKKQIASLQRKLQG